MSDHEFGKKCSQAQEEEIEKLFSKLSLDAKQEEPAILLENEGKFEKQQSFIHESAQKHVVVLENLMKNVKPGWYKIVAREKVLESRPPQAYLFKDIYEQKKQQLLQQQQEQERAQRQFRSRPMPDFSQAHRLLVPKPTVHRITCAVSPNVLKTSRIMLQKRDLKIEQLQKQRDKELRLKTKPLLKIRMAPIKPSNIQMHLQVRPFTLFTELRAEQRKIFHAQVHKTQEARRHEQEQQQKRRVDELRLKTKPLLKLKLTPLKPGNHPMHLDVRPFSLFTELRAKQRKIFHAQVHETQEARRREQEVEEEQRQMREREEYRKTRQMATFRAQPNPFKAQYGGPRHKPI